MAKSKMNRHHTLRLLNNYKREFAHRDFVIEGLSFGRAFKADPVEAGLKYKCRCDWCECSRTRHYKGKKKAVLDAWKELLE